MTSTATAPRPSVHAGHAHPATKAGRAACRRAMKGSTGATFAPTPDTWPVRIDRSISHTVKLTAVGTKTGYRFHVQGPDRKLTSPTYVTSVQGPKGDWFETRSFLDQPVD